MLMASSFRTKWGYHLNFSTKCVLRYADIDAKSDNLTSINTKFWR